MFLFSNVILGFLFLLFSSCIFAFQPEVNKQTCDLEGCTSGSRETIFGEGILSMKDAKNDVQSLLEELVEFTQKYPEQVRGAIESYQQMLKDFDKQK